MHNRKRRREQHPVPRKNEFAALLFEVELIAETLRSRLPQARRPGSPIPFNTDEWDVIHRQFVVATNRLLLLSGAVEGRPTNLCFTCCSGALPPMKG